MRSLAAGPDTRLAGARFAGEFASLCFAHRVVFASVCCVARAYPAGYGVNLEQRRLERSRTSLATPSSSTLRNTVPMSDATSRISSGPMPAVVHDAEPKRRPLVTNGFSGSFGI